MTLAADVLALVDVPSNTGEERGVMVRAGELAAALGLDAQLHEHDLAALRAHPDHPGEEVPRSELVGLTVLLPGTAPGRLAVNGHLDTVPGGPAAKLDGDRVHGRGSVDMKGGWVAALHALAALRDAGGDYPSVVLMGVSSEEDGGLGTFAALEADSAFDACFIPEPTAWDVIVAQAGALTFKGVVSGKPAHAAMRLEGESALDHYIDVIAPAIRAHERAINSDVEHPAMRALELPYPISVGRLAAGDWSSTVPHHLMFEGRLGVRVGEDPDAARAAFEEALGLTLGWAGGAFASGETAADHPWVDRVCAALGGSPSRTGVPYGADMRLFTARGIPTVMLGTTGLERAHSTDEWVSVEELERLRDVIARALGGRS